MQERARLRGLPLMSTAVGGVLVGHWLAYVAAIPRASVRAAALADSGHSYLDTAVRIAVVLAVAGVGTILLRLLAWSDGQAAQGRAGTLRWVAVRLAVLQVLGFTAMETAERVAAGAPVAGMFAHHVFAIGLLLQVLVACVASVLLLRFLRVAERLVLAIRGAYVEPATLAPLAPTRLSLLPVPILAGAWGLRGPPSR
jgi:hypothetical protein